MSVGAYSSGTLEKQDARAVFPAPSRPIMMTENSSFLTNEGRGVSREYSYIPRKIFVKSLQQVVHDGEKAVVKQVHDASQRDVVWQAPV